MKTFYLVDSENIRTLKTNKQTLEEVKQDPRFQGLEFIGTKGDLKKYSIKMILDMKIELRDMLDQDELSELSGYIELLKISN